MRRFEDHHRFLSRSAFSHACTRRSTDRSEGATSSCRRSEAARRRTRRRTIQANRRFERTSLPPPRDDLSSHARLTDARATLRHARRKRTNALGVIRNNCVEVHPNANANETRATNGDTNPAKTNANETRRSPIRSRCGWSCTVSMVDAIDHYDRTSVDVAASSSAMALAGARSSGTCLLDTSTSAGVDGPRICIGCA